MWWYLKRRQRIKTQACYTYSYEKGGNTVLQKLDKGATVKKYVHIPSLRKVAKKKYLYYCISMMAKA